MTDIVTQPKYDTNDELWRLQRFDIATALAAPFRGLPDAVESNLHRASRNGDSEKVGLEMLYCTTHVIYLL